MAEQSNIDPNLQSNDVEAAEEQKQQPESPATPRSSPEKSSSEEGNVENEEHVHQVETKQQTEHEHPEGDQTGTEPAEDQHHDIEPSQHQPEPAVVEHQTNVVAEVPAAQQPKHNPDAPVIGLQQLSSDVYVSAYSNFQDVEAAAQQHQAQKQDSDEEYMIAREPDGNVVARSLHKQDPFEEPEVEKQQEKQEEQQPEEPPVAVDDQVAEEQTQQLDEGLHDAHHQDAQAVEEEAVGHHDAPIQHHHPVLDEATSEIPTNISDSVPVTIGPDLLDSVPTEIILAPKVAHEQEAAHDQHFHEASQPQKQIQPEEHHQLDSTSPAKVEQPADKEPQSIINWQPVNPVDHPSKIAAATAFTQLRPQESMQSGLAGSVHSEGKFNLLEPPQPQIKANSQEELFHTIRMQQQTMRRSTEKKKQELQEMKGNSFLNQQSAENIHMEKRIERNESEVPEVPRSAETMEDIEPKKEIKRPDYVDVNANPIPKPRKEQKVRDNSESCKCSMM